MTLVALAILFEDIAWIAIVGAVLTITGYVLFRNWFINKDKVKTFNALLDFYDFVVLPDGSFYSYKITDKVQVKISNSNYVTYKDGYVYGYLLTQSSNKDIPIKMTVTYEGLYEEMSGEKANMKEYPSGDDITSNGALGNMFSSIFSSQFEQNFILNYFF